MLRDKFAMAAMQGELAGQCEGCSWANEQNLAARSYEVADAMMKERANWDFSGDPDYLDIQRMIDEQSRMPILPSGTLESPTPIKKRPVPPDVERPPIKYE